MSVAAPVYRLETVINLDDKNFKKAVNRAEKNLEWLRKRAENTAVAFRKSETAVQALGRKVKEHEQTIGAWSASLTRMGIAAATAVGSVAVVGAKFDTQMRRVRAVAKMTDAEFEAMPAKARELGKSTSFSATEVASGFEFMRRAGIETSEALGSMAGVLALAEAETMELADAANIVAGVMDQPMVDTSASGSFRCQIRQTP